MYRGHDYALSPIVSLLFSLGAATGSTVVTEEALDGMLHLPEVVQRQIRLSPNHTENQLLRTEFYYEQVIFPLIAGDSHQFYHLTI